MAGKILETSRPAVSVKDFSRQEIIDFLKSKLADQGVQAAFIFGSVAWERARYWSDIDVLIVKQTTQPFVERGREFMDLFDLGLAVDILVYTPAEFHAMKQEPSFFWRQIEESLVRIC